MRALCFFLSILLAAPSALAAERVAVAYAADTPPASPTLAAFYQDITNALCDQMRAECDIVAMPRQRLVAALTSGEADAVLTLPATADYPEGVYLTERLYRSGARFTRHKDNSAKIAYKKMAGARIAVVQNSLYDAFAGKKFPGAVIAPQQNIAAARAALQDGSADFLLHDRATEYDWTSQQDNYEQAGPNYTLAKYFPDMVIGAATPALQQNLNAAITALLDNGAYQEINKRHFPFNLYGRRKR